MAYTKELTDKLESLPKDAKIADIKLQEIDDCYGCGASKPFYQIETPFRILVLCKSCGNGLKCLFGDFGG